MRSAPQGKGWLVQRVANRRRARRSGPIVCAVVALVLGAQAVLCAQEWPRIKRFFQVIDNPPADEACPGPAQLGLRQVRNNGLHQGQER